MLLHAETNTLVTDIGIQDITATWSFIWNGLLFANVPSRDYHNKCISAIICKEYPVEFVQFVFN